MKVLMLGNHESVHGGITSVIKQLLNYNWRADNIQMKFIATYKYSNNILKILYFIWAYFKILIYIMKEKPDIVHVHMSHSGSFVRVNFIKKMCMRLKTPIVVHLHGSEFKKFYKNSSSENKKEIIRLFNDISGTIVLGEQWKKFILDISPDANVIVLNNTVKIPELVQRDVDKDIQILFLGVLIERKGVSDILKSFKKLKDIGILEKLNVKFNIGGSGIEEVKLKEFVELNEMNDYINFLGWINEEEKKEMLKRNQLFVLPSYNEGLPIAILEAMSYGLAIVSTDVGSIQEAVHDNINGFIVTPGNIDGYFEALKELIINKDLRVNMMNQSRKIALEKFDEKNYFKRIKILYEEIGKKNE